MFADPISVRHSDTAENHVRVGISSNEGRFYYIDGDDNQTVVIKQNQSKARFRREFRIVRDTPYSDPLTGNTTTVSASVYLVIDEPRAGFEDSTLNDMVNSLVEFFDDANETNVYKLLAGEY